MLQDKAKISIELDLDTAKKQRDDLQKGLDESTRSATQKIEKTKEDVKSEEQKEVERQRSSLADKLKRIAETPLRLVSPDLPEQVMRTIPYVGGALAFTYRDRDTLEVMKKFIEHLNIPGTKGIIKATDMAEAMLEKAGLDAHGIREMKAKWESISRTLEDITSAYRGILTSGNIPSAQGSETFISRLYQFNSMMALQNKNKSYLQNEILAKNIGDIFHKMVPGRGQK